MSRVLLPQVHGNATVGAQGMNANAAAFVIYWLHMLGDRANDMVQDNRLVTAAQLHADYLHEFDIRQFRHVGRGGSTANQRARAQGYRLPDWYPVVGNQIESIGEEIDGGPEQAMQDLIDSPLHTEHVMRRGWWAKYAQPVYGVGWAGIYYVVVTAPEEV